ncbi:MAG: serine/threonine protein kinase [Anaerolineales bacterium]|nr:serine/threonine protein kinase [Anaerolineales bacterium]
MSDLTGQTIEQYEVRQRLLGRPESDLYLGHDPRTDTAVFLEIAHATAAEDADFAARFRRRMEIVAQLQHPAIAPVLHVGQAAGQRPFAAIEHRPGHFLAAHLPGWHDSGSHREPQTALSFVRQLAAPLAVAHPAGIFHHDLRPANVYLQADDTPWFVDLGVPIAPIPQNLETLRTTKQLDYASPEQLQGQALSGRSNVYSLGVLLYELLAGHRPRLPLSDWDIFDRQALPLEESLEDARGGLRPETYRVAKHCLWQKDWSRYNTVQEMIAALDTALAAQQTPPARPLVPPQTQPHFRLYVILTAVLLLIAVAVVAFLLLR